MAAQERAADDALFRDAELLAALTALRIEAVNKRLDMTDAMSEFCGTGKDTNLGMMPKNRFRAAMGTIFKGVPLPPQVLNKCCVIYGAGDRDPLEPGTKVQVLYKQFAKDFDEISIDGKGPCAPMDEKMTAWLQQLKLTAVNKRLDMTDAFEEFAPTESVDASLGMMAKNRFRSAIGTIFSGDHIDADVLTSICAAYGAGDPDPREPGTQLKVRFRQFAIDFDNLPLVAERACGKPDPALIVDLQRLKSQAINRRLDLTDAFEEMAGKGSRDASLGIMQKNRFRSTLGQLFQGVKLSDDLLFRMCATYGTGDADMNEEGTMTKVFSKQFAIDFDELPATAPPLVGQLDDESRALLLGLRQEAGAKMLDMTDALAEYADGDMGAKNSGRMRKTGFISAIGTIFGGTARLTTPLIRGIFAAYGTGDPDPRDGTYACILWKQFAIDFDELPWERPGIKHKERRIGNPNRSQLVWPSGPYQSTTRRPSGT